MEAELLEHYNALCESGKEMFRTVNGMQRNMMRNPRFQNELQTALHAERDKFETHYNECETCKNKGEIQ